MLEPDARNLLLETLRPPPGYALDRAVGTTFTLDLLTLLTAPLAFTFFDWQDEEGRPTADPLALLEALRRHASRIHLFCQAGRIAVPPPDKPLLSYLEECVFEVRAARPGGIFHPKAWLLRFTAEDEPVVYRFLCLTRNLTFARSWDTALVLEGEFTDRHNAFAINHPLGEFVAALPDLAIREVPDDVQQQIDRLAHEVRRVRFQPPDGFDEIRFWPLGLPTAQEWPFPESNRPWLAIAPFMESGFLEKLQRSGHLRALVSRPEALSDLVSRPEGSGELDESLLDNVEEIYVLSPYSELDGQGGIDEQPGSEAETSGDGGASASDAPGDSSSSGGADDVILSEDELAELAGLHAKLFVMDDGWDARLWTGSANATTAAFERNVEFLVELRGRRKLCGIDALLGRANDTQTLRSLLQAYEPVPDDDDGPDPVQEELEARVDGIRNRILDLDLRARAEPARTIDAGSGGGNKTGEQTFALILLAASDDSVEPPDDVSVDVWPVTLHERRALRPEQPKTEEGQGESPPHAAEPSTATAAPDGDRILARFEPVSLQALTAFFAFEVEAHEESRSARARFVVRLPLDGAPEDRRERILRDLLSDPDQVLRLLLLLLSEGGMTVSEFIQASRQEGGDAIVFQGFGRSTLLESLLRALDSNPAALEDAERLIRDLEKTDEGEALLPAGLKEIWEPIWECHQQERRR